MATDILIVDDEADIRELVAGILEDEDILTMALPDDEDYGPAVESREDVEALFSHLRGER